MFYFRYFLLLGMPLCEMICGQIQGLWAPRMGPLSLAQAYHGGMLCVVTLYLLCRLRLSAERPLMVDVCIAIFILTVGASSMMSLRQNAHFQEDIIAFSQMLYWLIVWLIYAIECATAEGRRLVLRGVFAAGVYMAVSVILLFVVGGGAYSRYEGMNASFGGFSTAKSLGGILCVAALLSLRLRSLLLQTSLLCLSLGGLMLTYQRAGQLAILAAILWLIGMPVLSRMKQSLLSTRSIAVFACALVAVAGFVDTGALTRRWRNADVSLGGKAGSGRVGLWTDAFHAFESMKWPGKMLGVGYSGMRDAMFHEGMGGNRKHTHSDVLDILLAFGFLGMLGWVAVHYAMIQTVRASPRTSTEYAVGGGIYVVFLVESLLTGQVFGTATMIVYLGAITGLSGADSEPFTGAYPFTTGSDDLCGSVPGWSSATCVAHRT